jgi:thioredoxin-like negative regulator of GroEL
MDKKDLQVVVFVTSWCPHCKDMRNNVWTDSEVLKRVESYFEGRPAIIQVDQPGNEYLSQQFEIEAFPTVVIMDEARKIHKRAKNMTSEETIKFLEEETDAQ